MMAAWWGQLLMMAGGGHVANHAHWHWCAHHYDYGYGRSAGVVPLTPPRWLHGGDRFVAACRMGSWLPATRVCGCLLPLGFISACHWGSCLHAASTRVCGCLPLAGAVVHGCLPPGFAVRGCVRCEESWSPTTYQNMLNLAHTLYVLKDVSYRTYINSYRHTG